MGKGEKTRCIYYEKRKRSKKRVKKWGIVERELSGKGIANKPEKVAFQTKCRMRCI